MTRKDYRAIAEALKKAKQQSEEKNENLYDTIVYRVADVFFNDNARFDYWKFYSACGIGEV